MINQDELKHTVSVLVDNEPGVLARVIGLISGRGYNIDSLTVAEVDAEKHISRITIVAPGSEETVNKMISQLERLVPVKRAGIDPNMKFNQAVQDRIFFVHLDDNGLYGPWERWWIEQGGPGLATTAEEKEIIRRFREEYDPADPWNAARNQNPAVVKHKIKTEAGQ